MSLSTPPWNVSPTDENGLPNRLWIEWWMELIDFLPTSPLVDIDSAQTFTNKTMTAAANTFSGFLHGTQVDNPTSGVHGATGAIVGTTDTQALSAKTLTSPVLNTGVSGTAVATTVGNPGSDTILVSEQGIREAIAAAPGAPSLDGLTDVTIAAPANNEVLAYDTATSEWINQTPVEASLCDLSTAQTLAGPKTLTSPVVNTQITGTAILDEDNFVSNSDTKVATQQSIKAYVTAAVAAGGGAKMATGTYTGDAAATKAITGVGFQPKAILVHRKNSGYHLVYKNDQDALLAWCSNGAVYLNDQIISFDADGFTVGDGTGAGGRENLNTNAAVFGYTAWG